MIIKINKAKKKAEQAGKTAKNKEKASAMEKVTAALKLTPGEAAALFGGEK